MQPVIPSTPPAAAKLEPGDLVDEREAAAILGCAVQSLRNWRWRRTGPKWVRVGQRLVRYNRASLAAFLKSGDDGERAA